MLAIPLLAALTVSRKVEHAVRTYRLRAAPPRVAGPEEIDARLDAVCADILALTAARAGAGLYDVDDAVAHAFARAQEWTA